MGHFETGPRTPISYGNLKKGENVSHLHTPKFAPSYEYKIHIVHRKVDQMQLKRMVDFED